jgi:4-hydroxybenzoate polyprenyltransferase
LEEIVLVLVYIFIRILVGTILCDVADRKGDIIAGVETIPLRLGRKKTKKLLIIMNSFAVFWLAGLLHNKRFVYAITACASIRMPVRLFGNLVLL